MARIDGSQAFTVLPVAVATLRGAGYVFVTICCKQAVALPIPTDVRRRTARRDDAFYPFCANLIAVDIRFPHSGRRVLAPG